MAIHLSSHGMTQTDCSVHDAAESHQHKHNSSDLLFSLLQHEHDDAEHYHWHITIPLLSEDLLRTTAPLNDLRIIDSCNGYALSPDAYHRFPALTPCFGNASFSLDHTSFLTHLSSIRLLN